ncbi:MAG: helicase HerA-like domain-containing protein [Methylococcales bacterium]
MAEIILGGSRGKTLAMDAAMANRHGIISGATGSGKTVTLQVLAEGFSRIGVPVFMADIKGDLSGIALPGSPSPKIEQRLVEVGVSEFEPTGSPSVFWDIFARNGHPVRTTISDLGPLLLGSLLELNDTQTGVLYSAFKIADNFGLLLLDLKDLRSLLTFMGQNSAELKAEYGNFSPASIGAIQRQLLVLEEQGAEYLFGEPVLDLRDLMQTDFSGNGVISLLDATDLVSKAPRLYATFLLWLLSEVYDNLPEKGDLDRPQLVLFFDEAHLLFDRAPSPLLDKIEQVVRLVRSKGIGIFFITQSPLDIPESVLGQLGLRIQHVLRAFTPKDRKTVNSVAETFRQNPAFDARQCITELGIGEALVSTLDAKGMPTPVQRILIRPPASQIGPLSPEQRAERIRRSPLHGRYDTPIDRKSAYELLKHRAEAANWDLQPERAIKSSPGNRQSIGEALVKSAARSIGSQLGRQLIRGLMGSLLGGKRR